jgi:endonuclease YncB( thermonuclease family)
LNKLYLFFNPALLSLVFLTFPLNSSADERLLPLRDIQVEDGDTLILNIEGKTQRIQLTGIDTPEDVENPKLKVDQSRTKLDKDKLLAMGTIATEQLRYLIKTNAPFILHFNPNKRDRYARIPGDIVNSKGQSISALMINNGYAVVTIRSTDPELVKRLKPLQQKSIDENQGLWGLYARESRLWAGIEAK